MTDTEEPVTPVRPPLFSKSKKVTEFATCNKIFFGYPKTGKTTLAAAQKVGTREPLFIATEDGHGAIEVFQQRVTTWDGFKRLVDHLQANAAQVKEEYSCVILDLISDLDSWCAQHVAATNKVRHLSDLDFGKGFAMAREEFSTALTKLLAITPVTFIGHAQEKEILWNGEKIKVQAPSLSKGALEFVNGKVDLIGWINPATAKHAKAELCFRPDKGTICGSRFPQLVKNFPIDYAKPEATYAAIQDAFDMKPDTTKEGTPK